MPKLKKVLRANQSSSALLSRPHCSIVVSEGCVCVCVYSAVKLCSDNIPEEKTKLVPSESRQFNRTLKLFSVVKNRILQCQWVCFVSRDGQTVGTNGRSNGRGSFGEQTSLLMQRCVWLCALLFVCVCPVPECVEEEELRLRRQPPRSTGEQRGALLSHGLTPAAFRRTSYFQKFLKKTQADTDTIMRVSKRGRQR